MAHTITSIVTISFSIEITFPVAILFSLAVDLFNEFEIRVSYSVFEILFAVFSVIL